jgi:hypothetical protein
MSYCLYFQVSLNQVGKFENLEIEILLKIVNCSPKANQPLAEKLKIYIYVY